MRILMIEDLEHYSNMMVRLLDGLDIDVATSLGEAKVLLGARRYDMMLVDLGLPDSAGLDTLRALKGYKVPKVVLTGQLEVSMEAVELGVADFLHKTDRLEQIYERIMFNVKKIEKAKKPRFSPEVFGQIRACFERSAERELTYA